MVDSGPKPGFFWKAQALSRLGLDYSRRALKIRRPQLSFLQRCSFLINLTFIVHTKRNWLLTCMESKLFNLISLYIFTSLRCTKSFKITWFFSCNVKFYTQSWSQKYLWIYWKIKLVYVLHFWRKTINMVYVCTSPLPGWAIKSGFSIPSKIQLAYLGSIEPKQNV